MKILMWDFDNTLAHRDGMWSKTLHDVLKKNGVEYVPLEKIRPFLNIGFTWHSPDTAHKQVLKGKSWWEYVTDYFTEIYELVGIKKEEARKYALQIREEYNRIEKWHVYPDVEKTLQKAKERGFRNIVASNHIPELEEIVERLGIKEYFTEIFTSGKIGYEKPNKYFYKYILEEIEAIAEECIMIGDSYEVDVAGALRSGMRAILVRRTNDKEYAYYAQDLETMFEVIDEMVPV